MRRVIPPIEATTAQMRWSSRYGQAIQRQVMNVGSPGWTLTRAVFSNKTWVFFCLLSGGADSLSRYPHAHADVYPMTRWLAVAEAAVSGLEVFMAAGGAPPTSGEGLCMLGDTLTFPAPSQAAR